MSLTKFHDLLVPVLVLDQDMVLGLLADLVLVLDWVLDQGLDLKPIFSTP